jgi:hypothetical protein
MPKITVIDSGSAIEKPMNEPKVTMYSAVIDQVCLLLEDRELLGDASFIVAEGGQLHHQQRADDVQRNRHPHADQPSPVGAGRYSQSMKIDGTKASVYR